MLVDDATFHANKALFNFEAVRSLHWRGGGVPSLSGVRLLKLFALHSMEPVRVDSNLLHSGHVVGKWLRSRGLKVPEQDNTLSAVAMRELRECFDALDDNLDGSLSLAELREALDATQVFSETDVVNTLFASLAKKSSKRGLAGHGSMPRTSPTIASPYPRLVWPLPRHTPILTPYPYF